jgi:hypothetical protein
VKGCERRLDKSVCRGTTVRCLMEGFGLLGAARLYPQRGRLFSDMTCGGVYGYQGDAHGAN